MKLQTMWMQLEGLVVFRDLLKDDVIAKFTNILKARMAYLEEGNSANVLALIRAVAQFEQALFEGDCGANWSDYLFARILESENIGMRRAAKHRIDAPIAACLTQELQHLQVAGQVTLSEVAQRPDGTVISELSFLPQWQTAEIAFEPLYRERLLQVNQKGYGMFAKYHAFTVENGALVPVQYPDPQRLEDLPGYEREREKVIANTKALLHGEPANNVLLYGDAGTGKSSSVKAIVNAYACEGLRLVEVKKNQLYQLPAIMEQLAQNPLKFLLFIDDLSFTANDDNFAALKAILEGSICGRAANIAVYATSNRRHLIKELMSDRTGDDIHESDTRQELMSLSARFGLTVTFQRPEKAKYEEIVSALAEQYGVAMNMEQLIVRAEAFAIRAGGRSPRVAKQFIEQCKAGVQ